MRVCVRFQNESHAYELVVTSLVVAVVFSGFRKKIQLALVVNCNRCTPGKRKVKVIHLEIMLKQKKRAGSVQENHYFRKYWFKSLSKSGLKWLLLF